MKRTLWLAVITGAAIEAALSGLFFGFGVVGPEFQMNHFTTVLFFLHLPSIVVTRVLPKSNWILFPVFIGVAAAQWSIAAFVVIAAVRSLYAGPAHQNVSVT